MSNPSYIGIEIGGTKLQVVTGTDRGEITSRHRFPVDRDKGGAGIRAQIESVIPDLVKATAFGGIGVGFGGPVNWRTGQIALSHHIEGWTDFPLGAWLTELSGGLPTHVDNDANVAGLAEASLGAGRDANPVFYVTLGSGVGGGLVIDGSIVHGSGTTEYEIGHLRLDRSGAIVENSCSGWAVNQKIRDGLQRNPASLLTQLTANSSNDEAKHLHTALADDDELAHEILEHTATDLAFALSHVTHLAHPETVILGGGLSLLGQPLLDAVNIALPAYIMSVMQPGPTLKIAGLGEDVVPIGALLLAAQTRSPSC